MHIPVSAVLILYPKTKKTINPKETQKIYYTNFQDEVIEVKEDALFGNSITIQSDTIQITYQSLDALNFEKGAYVKQKDVIGKASLNTYNPALGNHLHVELYHNGKVVNPEEYYDKLVGELQ